MLVVLSFAATFVFAARGADSYDLAYVFGYIFAPVILYILLFGWWLDHIVARTGMWGSFAIHGGAGFVLAALATFSQMTAQSEGRAAPELELAGVPPTMPMFIWIVGWPLSHLVASMLKKSFPPKASASAAATLA